VASTGATRQRAGFPLEIFDYTPSSKELFIRAADSRVARGQADHTIELEALHEHLLVAPAGRAREGEKAAYEYH